MTRQEIEAAFHAADPDDYLAFSVTEGPPLCNSQNLSRIVLLLREIACQLADLNAANTPKPEPKHVYDPETETYR